MSGHEEFKERAFEPVKEFCKFLKEQEDGEPATITQYIPEDGKFVEKDLIYFQEFSGIYKKDSWEFFDSIVDWLLVKGNAHDKDTAFIKQEEGVWGPVEDPNDDELRQDYLEELLWLTDHALSYSGGYEIDRESYEEAFEDTYSRQFRFPTREKYLFPLIYFNSSKETVELDGELEFLEDRTHFMNIEIGPPTPKELAALKGTHLEPVNQNSFVNEWETIIRIDSKGFMSRNEEEIASAVLSSLRIFQPEKPGCYLGQSIQLEYGPLYYRKNLLRVIGYGLVRDQYPQRWRTNYSLPEEDIPNFQEFFDKYGEYMIDGKEHPRFSHHHDLISRPLGRFNDMYKDAGLGDKIVDGVIAFESTLLKDLGTQSSITFRLGLRASLLLENRVPYSRDFIRDFFDNLYFARGRVVHHDDTIQEIISKDKFKKLQEEKMTPHEFVQLTRYFLAETLSLYIKKEKQDGMSITEVNQKLDDIVRNTSSNGFNGE